MITSMQSFRSKLYLEHLEEASFLFDQRINLRRISLHPWEDLAELEERLEAHIDALVVGGALATEVCRVRWREGDEGGTVCRRRAGVSPR